MENNKQEIFVFGASGHSKVVIDVIERQGRYRICHVIDDNPVCKGSVFRGYRVLGDRHELLARGAADRGIVAVGVNSVRREIVTWLREHNFGFVSAVHPDAVLGRDVSVAPGSVVMAGVVINTDSQIGEHCIINSGASVDHDCIIHDFAHIAPGTTLCGTVQVGAGTLVGAGTTVLPNCRIGTGAVIGAGTVVKNDIGDAMTAIGTVKPVVR